MPELHSLPTSSEKISHDMCAYVINRVIIPRIEYWSQHISIPDYVCKNGTSKLDLFSNNFYHYQNQQLTRFSPHTSTSTLLIYSMLC